MKLPSHGANPHYLYEALGMEMPDTVIDFSANINPLGPPEVLWNHWNDLFGDIDTYPDPHATRLKKVISEREGIDENKILIGNGGAEIISLIGKWLNGKRVLIVEPAFSEYERALRANHCLISYDFMPVNGDLNFGQLIERISSFDAVFFCNPNNPTGIYFPKQKMEWLLEACDFYQCYLIVDEAFYDFTGEYESLVPLFDRSRYLILIRSLTKMYAIPGLRLGYCLAGRDIIRQLAKEQAHWSVNGIAQKAGELCLEEEEFVKRTQRFVKAEREKLFRFFHETGFLFSPSSVNFYLLKEKDSDDPCSLLKFLLQHGIVPRHTYNFPGLEGKWLRFAVKSERENRQLTEVMQEWRKRNRSFL